MDKIENILADCGELVAWELELEAKLKDKSSHIEEHKQNPILQVTNSNKEREKVKIHEERQQNQIQQFQVEKEKSLQLQINQLSSRIEGLQIQEANSIESATKIQSEAYEKLLSVAKPEINITFSPINNVAKEMTDNQGFMVKKCSDSSVDLTKASVSGNSITTCQEELVSVSRKRQSSVSYQIASNNKQTKLENQPELMETDQLQLQTQANLFLKTNIMKKNQNQGFVIKDVEEINLTNASVERNTIIQSQVVGEQLETNQGFSIEKAKKLEAQGAKVEGNIIAETENSSKRLEQLIVFAKSKLKSASQFSAKQKERDRQLETFFKNLPASQKEFIKELDKIKKDLSKKLTQEEINNLCQAQAENNYFQSQLGKVEELVEQQTFQIHNPSQNS